MEVSSLLKIKKEEVAEMNSDFSYQITEISRYTKAEVNQELFDQVFGKDAVKDEKDFREKIAEGLKTQFEVDADFTGGFHLEAVHSVAGIRIYQVVAGLAGHFVASPLNFLGISYPAGSFAAGVRNIPCKFWLIFAVFSAP